jgi:hypothetical protein
MAVAVFLAVAAPPVAAVFAVVAVGAERVELVENHAEDWRVHGLSHLLRRSFLPR